MSAATKQRANAAAQRAQTGLVPTRVAAPLRPDHRPRSTRSNAYSRRRVACQLQLTKPGPAPRQPVELSPPAPTGGGLHTLPQLWDGLAARYGDAMAVQDPHQSPASRYSFAELADSIHQFAAGLQSLGLSKGDKVSLFSENSSRWLVADQAIMMCGAADAVRGTGSSLEELRYIMQHSESSALVVQDAATLDKLLPALEAASPQASPIRFVVLLWGEASSNAASALGQRLLSFDAVLARGAGRTFHPPQDLSGSDLATLVYTSGTTGQPKGVMLTHSNLLYQVNHLDNFLPVDAGDRTLSLLPPWHIYERACGYYLSSRGAGQVYSNIRKFREDLTTYPPDYFVCVPLVLDTLHGRVLQTLKKASSLRRTLATSLLAASAAFVRARRVVEGVDLRYAVQPRPLTALVAAWLQMRLLVPLYWLCQRLVVAKVRTALGIRSCVISGGGSLAAHLDDFYESIGLPVINGWGLTETSPVLACRVNQPGQNVRGSVGQPTPGTEVRVVDPETLADVAEGQQGLLLARGPGVMAGYWQDDAATAKAFKASEGWFDTGDLGWRAPAGVAGSNMAGSIVLTGRAKDTIVLTSGENVEPQPLEDALCCSPFIKFAVLAGHGRRALGALIVPNSEALEELAAARGGPLTDEAVRELVGAEVRSALASRMRWEHVAAFEVLAEPFSVEDGTLTRTMKPRRQAIMEKYAVQVARLESQLR
ncbi:hypothetical protein D9Q98_004738 [Chlorella vulgaris]|uniref:AMP-dependent synthetase/ligase domain-containing protein n=1 Tax=Chlorella vulgaris TaxID=3077 RepID=A0A9D4TQG6_CHLVU|nr:hypothetical protein D9Q98_004738 [Chlorella vulgaris]